MREDDNTPSPASALRETPHKVMGVSSTMATVAELMSENDGGPSTSSAPCEAPPQVMGMSSLMATVAAVACLRGTVNLPAYMYWSILAEFR